MISDLPNSGSTARHSYGPPFPRWLIDMVHSRDEWCGSIRRNVGQDWVLEATMMEKAPSNEERYNSTHKEEGLLQASWPRLDFAPDLLTTTSTGDVYNKPILRGVEVPPALGKSKLPNVSNMLTLIHRRLAAAERPSPHVVVAFTSVWKERRAKPYGQAAMTRRSDGTTTPWALPKSNLVILLKGDMSLLPGHGHNATHKRRRHRCCQGRNYSRRTPTSMLPSQ